MKKLLAWVLTCILVLTSVSAVWAEDAGDENVDEAASLEETAAETVWPITYDYIVDR